MVQKMKYNRRRSASAEPSTGKGRGTSSRGGGHRGNDKQKRRKRSVSDQQPAKTAGERSKGSRGRTRDRKGRDNPAKSSLMEWIKSLGIALIIFGILRTFVIQAFVITSGSMAGSLLVGDMVAVNRAAIGSRIPFTDLRIPGYSSPTRGDVISFDPHHDDTLTLVKRLVGMPGDTLEMRDRELFLNGESYPEPYARYSGEVAEHDQDMRWQIVYLAPGVAALAYHPTTHNWGPLIIPGDRYFMLGDNSDASLDSRYRGRLDGWRLQGRAAFIYFSFNKGSMRPFPWIREVRWGRLFSGVD